MKADKTTPVNGRPGRFESPVGKSPVHNYDTLVSTESPGIEKMVCYKRDTADMLTA